MILYYVMPGASSAALALNPISLSVYFCFVFQSVQHEYTSVLACLVKNFPTKKEFRDLVQLTDYNDPESDFFEHMKHIQVLDGPVLLLYFPRLGHLTNLWVCVSPRSTVEPALWGGLPNSWPRAPWRWPRARFRTTSCHTPWPPCWTRRCWWWRQRINEVFLQVFFFFFLTFSFTFHAAAWEHDVRLGGGGGGGVPQADLVQIPVLPEALRPHPADGAGRAETGRQVELDDRELFYFYFLAHFRGFICLLPVAVCWWLCWRPSISTIRPSAERWRLPEPEKVRGGAAKIRSVNRLERFLVWRSMEEVGISRCTLFLLLSIRPSVHPFFVYSSVCPVVHPSVRPFVHPSILACTSSILFSIRPSIPSSVHCLSIQLPISLSSIHQYISSLLFNPKTTWHNFY